MVQLNKKKFQRYGTGPFNESPMGPEYFSNGPMTRCTNVSIEPRPSTKYSLGSSTRVSGARMGFALLLVFAACYVYGFAAADACLGHF
ncbi:hypothetical protein MUK42_35020 [Musa troglodytarum]|uniref:Uncharacterized protein n=1 Tax=Musa troglodytarum TaxID=320322 RepID=A0A9E7JBH3_9LILI|nr:hypothetical protein MUK42_35020 [Musa troglodytarum]